MHSDLHRQRLLTALSGVQPIADCGDIIPEAPCHATHTGLRGASPKTAVGGASDQGGH